MIEVTTYRILVNTLFMPIRKNWCTPFITEDKKTILVNDWGSAVSISAQQSKFSGTVVGGSDNLLNSLLHNDWPPPKYSDDLHIWLELTFVGFIKLHQAIYLQIVMYLILAQILMSLLHVLKNTMVNNP